jgi:hypothetical protein
MAFKSVVGIRRQPIRKNRDEDGKNYDGKAQGRNGITQ